MVCRFGADLGRGVLLQVEMDLIVDMQSDVKLTVFGGDLGKVCRLRDFGLDDLTASSDLEQVQPLIRHWLCCCVSGATE